MKKFASFTIMEVSYGLRQKVEQTFFPRAGGWTNSRSIFFKVGPTPSTTPTRGLVCRPRSSKSPLVTWDSCPRRDLDKRFRFPNPGTSFARVTTNRLGHPLPHLSDKNPFAVRVRSLILFFCFCFCSHFLFRLHFSVRKGETSDLYGGRIWTQTKRIVVSRQVTVFAAGKKCFCNILIKFAFEFLQRIDNPVEYECQIWMFMFF